MATDKHSPFVAKLKLQFKAFRDERLSSTDKLVLATLVTFHNGKTGRLNPGYDAIAKRASLGRRTVIRVISRLVLAGYVTVTHRPLKRGNETNTYRLTGVYPVNESTIATAETATGEVVSERHHPSATAAPPPSATAAPKLTEILEQSERTLPPLRHPPASKSTGTTTALTSTDGISAENICPEAQAQPQQATSRDVACLQGGGGDEAQAQRQHHESRNGAEKEQVVKADDFAKLRRKIAQAPRRGRRPPHAAAGGAW